MHQKYLEELEERFLRYVRIDTQSASGSTETPSTSQQLDLLRLLESELKMLGAEDVVLTDYGCVLATIPATVAKDVPTVALLAHVDTATGFNATSGSAGPKKLSRPATTAWPERPWPEKTSTKKSSRPLRTSWKRPWKPAKRSSGNWLA